MRELKLFIEALEELFTDKNTHFIINKVSTPSRFPAYTNVSLNVYEKTNQSETIISTVEETGKTVTAEEKTELENLIIKKSIKNILEYYGIK